VNWVNAVVQGVLLGGLYALFACGLSLMFGVMRIVNLAHGDFAVAAAFGVYAVVTWTALPLGVAVAVVVPAFAALGYLLQRGVIQRSLAISPLSTLLVTFGISIIVQNLLQQGFSADTRALDTGALVQSSVRVNDQVQVATLSLITFGLAIAVIVAVQLFLSRVPLGRMVRAAADDREASTLVGADSRHVYGVATAIALGTVALAGVMFATTSSFSPSAGPSRLIFAFEAVVIGGLGSLWGTLVGGMVLALAQTLGAQVNPALSLLAGHLVFLAVLALRPDGLLPRRVAA
jgi:branched-chain amino acid transport system permease protein